MTAAQKRNSRPDNYDRTKRMVRQLEEALDDALKNTFPASDPVSILRPEPFANLSTKVLVGESSESS
jgi:hypothetical protein